MAEQVDVEVIRVDTGKAVDNLKELNEYIKELKKTMNEAKIGSGEFKKAQDELDKVIVKQKQIMNGAANENKAAAGSFNALSNQLRELKEAWKATADEVKRDELGKQINDVKAQLNDMNHSIGNFQDQVGNYNGMLAPLFDSLGQKIDGLGGKLSQMTGTLGAMGFSVNGLVNPIKAVDAGFKLLSVNPIIAAMTLLIGLFLKVKDAIAANEELQRRWNVAMAAFQPIINAAKNALDALANAVVWVAEKVGALISLFSEASKETTELAEAQDKLNMSKREFKGSENAMRAEAKALKLQAKETNDLNEKLRLLNESRAKLKATNQQAVDLAAEELRIAEEQAKLAPNSKEDNEKIAELKQKLGQAQEKLNQEDTEYVELIKSADNGLKKLNTTTSTATDDTKKLADEVERMDKIIADSSKSQVQKLEEEKNKWVENYKQLKKNTKAVEEYFDKKIAKAKEEEEQVKKTEEQNRGKLIQSIDINWISGGSGSRKAGVDIAKEWNEQFRQITSTLKEPQLTEAKTKLAEIFRNQIFKEAWPTQAEVDKEVVAYFNKITGGIDSSTTNTALKEIAQLIQEKTADALKDAGQKTNLNLLDILGFKEDEDGRILFPKEPKQDEETLDLLKGKLKALKDEYFALAQEVASGKSPIPTEKLLGVADKAQAIEELQKIIALFEEIRIRYNAISDLSAAKSGNQLFTERFFGTKTDANGFATDGERLGKALRNTAKIWSDYGDAVTTVLDTIGDAWQKNLERQVKAGRMTEDEAKKQFKLIQAMQYSLSVVNAAASLIDIWADPSMGVYQKIATTVSVAAQNAANLITIATTTFGDMSSAASVGAAANYTPAVINDTNPVSYTRNLTSAEDVDSIADRLGAIKVYVTEKDITNAQNKVKTKVSESRF